MGRQALSQSVPSLETSLQDATVEMHGSSKALIDRIPISLALSPPLSPPSLHLHLSKLTHPSGHPHSPIPHRSPVAQAVAIVSPTMLHFHWPGTRSASARLSGDASFREVRSEREAGRKRAIEGGRRTIQTRDGVRTLPGSSRFVRQRAHSPRPILCVPAHCPPLLPLAALQHPV